MLLTEAERDNRINEFLSRKLKEFDLNEDTPGDRASTVFGSQSTTT